MFSDFGYFGSRLAMTIAVAVVAIGITAAIGVTVAITVAIVFFAVTVVLEV